LLTKDVLPGSRNETYTNQVAIVDSLSQRALVDYEVPSIKNISRTTFLHKVSTGESLYPLGNDENEDLGTYTRVEEITNNWHLSFGGYSSVGVGIDNFFGYDDIDIGIGARRKFDIALRD
jgi:hypothetical protein